MIGRVETHAIQVKVRLPFAGRAMLDFLAYHLVPGVETAGDGWYARTLDLPHGPSTLRLELVDDQPVGVTVGLSDARDLDEAVRRTRWLVAAAADSSRASAHLGADPLLALLVAARPGLRVPGDVDGTETAVRTVIGQQISVTGARTITARITAEHGRQIETGVPGLTHLFPTAAALAAADPATLPMPRARGRALVGLARAIAAGDLALERDGDATDVRRRLVALPGIGPWTADYVAMRALGEPDLFLPTDLGVRTAIARLGGDPAAVRALSAAWRPWRSYALMHLWASLIPPTPIPPTPIPPRLEQ